VAVSKVAEVTVERSTGVRSPTSTFTSWTPALNDLVILFCSDNLQGRTITIPSGWVNPLGGTTDVESDAHQMCAVYHWVTQAEVDAVTMTYTATDLYDASVTTGRTSGIVLRGVDTITPIDGSGTWSITTNSTSHHFPTVVAGDVSFDNDLVVRAVAHDGTGAYTNPAAHTVSTNATATQSMLVSTRDALTTAGVAVADTTVTQGTSGEGVGITLAVTAYVVPPAGPQLDGSVVEAEANAANATTGARDVATGRSVWIFVTHNNSSAATLTSAVTDNSASITPTLVARRNTQQGTVAEIWRGYNSSGSTVSGYTVTATGNNGGSGTLTRTHIVLAVFSGEEETFAGDSDVASSASGLPSITLTTTRDDSWCWSVKSDWSAGGVGTPGTSQSLVHNYSSIEYDSDVWNRTDRVTSGNNVTLNETAPSAQNFNQVAVEIRLVEAAATGRRVDRVTRSRGALINANHY